MDILLIANRIIGIVFFICYIYQFIYIPISAFATSKKAACKPKPNSIAVLICARNEEKVIGDLISSIHRQDYDRSLIYIFVMADNCTDNTAKIARDNGAEVYIRHSKRKIGKGYALDELLMNIKGLHPNGFDGYLVLDADNILSEDYISQMNICLSAGSDIVTGYRNSKNYADNWISSGYSVLFLRESRFLNGARKVLKTSCSVSGTGFMFSRGIYDEMGSWNYHLLTEDLEFTVDQILKGKRIDYCPDAVLYDEQPVRFSQSWHQRIRWTKGYIQVLRQYGIKLLKGIFKGRFACYDMSMSIFPAYLLSTVSVITDAVCLIIGLSSGASVLESLLPVFKMICDAYLIMFLIGAITVFCERKQIKASVFEKIRSIFTFPIFMFTFIPVSVCAIFCKPEWKKIEHNISVKNTP